MRRRWFAVLTVALLVVAVLVPGEVARASKNYLICPLCNVSGAEVHIRQDGDTVHYVSFHNIGGVHTCNQGDYWEDHTKNSIVSTTATCTEGGTTTYHCNVCDDNFTETTAARGHSFTNYTPDGNASCNADGTKTAKCDRCTKTNTIPDPGSKLGHSFTNYVTDTAATCTANGTETAICDRCSATDTRTVPSSALGHSFTRYASNGNASCSADGTKTATCDRCAETDTIADPGSALGHSFTVYVSDGNATCTADGTKTATCDRCTATDTRAVPGSALGHKYKTVLTSPTCTKGGYTTHTCTRCSDSYVSDKTAARGHWYGAWTASGDGTHAADCLRDGCKHTSKTQCTSVSCLLDGTEITLCPVCGEVSTGKGLLPVENATAQAVTQTLPRGELVLLCGALGDGTQIIVASFEYAGKPEQPTGVVKITLPEGALDGYNLLLIHEDGTETAVPCAVEDGLLTFELDFASEESAPALLIRLAPISA